MIGGYSCPNFLCSYFEDFGKLNELNFDRENRCKFCSAAGIHTKCDARKHVVYTENETEIFIYHYGQHSCKAKQLNERPKSEVSKTISVNPSVKPSQIQSNNNVSAIRNKRPWTEVEKIVKSFASIKNISNEKIKQKKILHPSGESFTAIDELKQHSDQKDIYIIYAFHENEQYVFKSLEVKMKMAQQMANASHYLDDEFCHFDGNYKRVKVCNSHCQRVPPLTLKTSISCYNAM